MACINKNNYVHLSIVYVLLLSYSVAVNGKALQITSANVDMVLATNEVVLLNFYADWCRFSEMLAPVFDEAADMVQKAFPEPGRVVLGAVNCEQEDALAKRFYISKYPTLKLLRKGVLTKKEYRGKRSADAFLEFLSKELADPIKKLNSTVDYVQLDDSSKRITVGFFDDEQSPEYVNFRKAAFNFKDDCEFYVGFGEVAKALNSVATTVPSIVFRPDVHFNGSLTSYDEVKIWMESNCIPLVRQITFRNAEELTEEGLPFLILFHNPNDKASVETYKHVIETELLEEKQNVNFLTADGNQFAHPLHHLGKSKSDMPLIAIDSFRHMYLFPKFDDIKIPGVLKTFLKDLYSGKLHREYHYGPDPVSNNNIEAQGNLDQTTLPESTFKKLAPSKNRYTLLGKDEL